jgi:hypothetical protein
VRAGWLVALLLCSCRFGFGPRSDDPPVTVASPAGGHYRVLPQSITLTSSEPGLVRYTLDGTDPGPDSPSGPSPLQITGLTDTTELRFFSETGAGTREAVRSERYVLDLQGPEDVPQLAVQDGALQWTTPPDPDFAGVLVTSLEPSSSGGGPQDGSEYRAGEQLGSGEVIYVGAAPSTQLPARGPGVWLYGVWPFDSAGNYGAVRYAAHHVPLPDQAATFSITAATGEVTLSEAPPLATVSATAAFDAGTLTVRITATNPSNGPIYGLKLVVAGTSHGAVANASGTIGVLPYISLGRPALPTGAQAEFTVVLTGVMASDLVTLRVRLSRAPVATVLRWGGNDEFGAGTVFDSSTGDLLGALPRNALATGLNLGTASGRPHVTPGHGYQGGGLSLDATTMYLGSRMAGRVTALRLADLMITGSVSLTTAGRSVTYVVADASRRVLYAVVCEGGAAPRWGGGQNGAPANEPVLVSVVRLEMETLVETGRLQLALLGTPEEHKRLRPRDPALSPDGRLLAVPVVSRDNNDVLSSVHLIDAAALRELDVDATRPGIQPVRIALESIAPRVLSFSGDGRTLYVAGTRSSSSARLAAVATTAPYLTTPVVAPDIRTIQQMVLGSDGSVYLAGEFTVNGLYRITSAGQLQRIASYSQHGFSLVEGPAGWLVGQFTSNGEPGAVLRVSAGSATTLGTMPHRLYGQWMAITPL